MEEMRLRIGHAEPRAIDPRQVGRFEMRGLEALTTAIAKLSYRGIEARRRQPVARPQRNRSRTTEDTEDTEDTETWRRYRLCDTLACRPLSLRPL